MKNNSHDHKPYYHTSHVTQHLAQKKTEAGKLFVQLQLSFAF